MSTISVDASGPFLGVTPDLYIGGKSAPLVDLPTVSAPPDMGLEIFAYILIFVCLVAIAGGGDKAPSLTPQPPAPPPVAPVPLPASAFALLTGFGFLAWWRR